MATLTTILAIITISNTISSNTSPIPSITTTSSNCSTTRWVPRVPRTVRLSSITLINSSKSTMYRCRTTATDRPQPRNNSTTTTTTTIRIMRCSTTIHIYTASGTTAPSRCSIQVIL
ncbi:uncharacterized protein PB18E9.04c-like [Copidosoma floridanum]|uniref:uncharacterized protein PB18E9.04c-like n=1 Tax=Copidosoma floridanum TaxID=29053 RepID=UPI0006C9C061|nr:uncharacterized protein PB18E9.04c-like [Copidosoma floridanum]